MLNPFSPLKNSCDAGTGVWHNRACNTLLPNGNTSPPEYDPEFLDFPNAPKYFISLCGTPNYLYALYNGFPATSGKSKIMVFTWQGAPVAIYQTDVKLERIAVAPSGRYVLGLNITEEGGSDVLKFEL